jgi:hypothetical protein
MLWFFRKVLDRLIVRVVGLVAVQIESHAQMEMSEMRAELLRRARELDREETPGMEEIAAELRSRAASIGQSAGPGSEVVALVSELDGEDLRTSGKFQHSAPTIAEDRPLAIESATEPKRGRARKGGVGDAANE